MNSKKQTHWGVFLAMAGLLIGQVACQPEAGEALNERKRRENAEEINAYLDKNNLRGREQQTESGLVYIVTNQVPSGQKPQTGDEVQYHFVRQRLDGVIVDSTEVAANKPSTITFDSPLLSRSGITVRLYEGLAQLREGEKAILLAPYDANDNKSGTLLLPAYTPVRYDVTVVSIRTEEEQIQDYLVANKLTAAQKTDSGLRFLLTQAYPDSAQVKSGQSLTVKYVGRLLNGKQFDKSDNYQFTLGADSIIKGWEEALLKMREGEKATFVLPSSIGYSAQGSTDNQGAQTIPPYSPLMFEIEVVSIK